MTLFKRSNKLTLLQLAGATYLMVSGGPYGLEELVRNCGYELAITILLLLPLIWSLPVGLMVGELSAAIPAEGGFYVWVHRALGPFWGFQEAWLSLLASVFDMAAYPTLFVLSLGRIWAPATHAYVGFCIGALMVLFCVLWNLFGARAIGEGSLILGGILLAPFVVLAICAIFWREHVNLVVTAVVVPRDLLAGVVIGMWNYMGWDNASTVAGEVEEPRRTYPRVMLIVLAATCLSYVLPIAAVWGTQIAPALWVTGSWVNIASLVGGQWFGIAMVMTTMVSSLGIFNALTLSYSRLPCALADDGYAPRILTRRLKNGVPWVSVVICGVAWTAALGLSFDRLLMLDILLYGASLMLEFIALITLRISEPELQRPFVVPGGLPGALLAGLCPAALLICAGIKSWNDRIGPYSAFTVGLAIAGAGVLSFFLVRRKRQAES